MRMKSVGGIVVAVVMACGLCFRGTAGASDMPVSLDLQGAAQYSRYNFTDVQKPYDGLDAYAVFKVAWWLDGPGRQLAPYVEIIPVYASEEAFWWQRHAQGGAGVQWYPLPADADLPWLRGLRLFVLAAGRAYYDKPGEADSQDSDLQAGADYYADNLLERDPWLAVAAFANAGYRKTNFATDDYSAFTFFGNLKVGPKLRAGDGLVLPYVVGDWNWSPSHTDRWWENSVKGGGGIAWYPLARPGAGAGQGGGFFRNPASRLCVFVEGVRHVASLGDDMPDTVERGDVRAGVSFSTGGYYRD